MYQMEGVVSDLGKSLGNLSLKHEGEIHLALGRQLEAMMINPPLAASYDIQLPEAPTPHEEVEKEGNSVSAASVRLVKSLCANFRLKMMRMTTRINHHA